MATKILLMLDDFIQSNLVLDQQCNFDIQLINVLLSHFVLSDLLNDRLSHTLELDFLIEVKVTVIEQMNKVLDCVDRRILAGCETLVCFSLQATSNKALDLDDLFHVLLEETLLLAKFGTNKRRFRSGLNSDDRLFLVVQLGQEHTDVITEQNRAGQSLKFDDLGSMVLKAVQESTSFLSL